MIQDVDIRLLKNYNSGMRIAGGINCGRKIYAPHGLRPTLEKVREAIFSIIDVDGKSFLDVYAGTGAVGLEAFSRGADEVWFIERSPKIIGFLKRNIESLDVENAKVIKGNAIQVLKRLEKKFDVVFLDPPYDRGLVQKTLDVLKGVTGNGSFVIIEHSPREIFDTGGFSTYRQKRYGDTSLTILIKEGL